ncbi:60S ribosomal protein L14-like [Crassostrea angulata]|uniref:Large ribosomal subunit protein eL14 n=2 Tax=Magallana gigas TaxID=29159 RepID=A0A8W8K2J0_MAGGI|nr:60S ribosomal protein L14 [Crassostrea gigas]XP_052718694.1 60S ribosomal protein L14-like [Crassostrea angulata]|eukprot:XP_011433871.1 PREDICTED: 60S ribosomal protein L14 [Crassostrea gigas]
MVLSQFRFVEVGRVAYISYGPDAGKLAVIVDVIDQNRALVDGPCSGVSRKQMNFKALELTSIVMKIPRGLRPGNLRKAWEKQEVQKKWDSTTWAQKIANKKKRAQLTDFDRFKLMKAKQARNRLINVEFGKLRKTVKRPAPRLRKKKSVKK